MAHRAAHDPAQHIAAALVRRQHAVGDQERRRAQMIGDHAQRGLLLAFRIGAGQFGDGVDQRDEQVDVVIVVLALQHRGDALQARAGIDRRLRQRIAHAALELLELHEHEIPDLDEAVAVLLRRARRSAPDLVAVVVEDFRTGPAGTGVAHLPEIVGAGDADDARLRQAGDLLPEIERLVVVDIDGCRQFVLRQAEFLGDQIPRQLDGAVLEIIAEREIAEHLEKGVMPRGVADIVEIVVLAAGAHAFLRGGGALRKRRFSTPVKTFLNCTMPALVNIKVGSLRGTSGDDGTISWPFAVKKFRNVDLISLTPLILVQSQNHQGSAAKAASVPRTAFRQGAHAVQKVCSGSGACRSSTRPVDTCCGCVDSHGGACVFLLSVQDSHVGRDRPLTPAPKEQPPRKLSGKRTA